MEIHTLIIYFIASIGLFGLLNKVLKSTISISHYVIISCIYILMLAGICSSYNFTKNNDSIFIVVLFELFIRICYVSMVKENNFFFNSDYVKRYLITFFVVFLLNSFFISKVSNVFLDMEQLKLLIWVLIVMYIAIISKGNDKLLSKKSVVSIKKDDEFIKREAIIMQYAKLKNRYSYLVKPAHRKLVSIIYAIMIYENKKRPEIFRKFDSYWYRLTGKGRKFGIMGIYSSYYIDDETSISIAIKKLNKIYYKFSKKSNIFKLILDEYYGNDVIVNDVIYIVNEIRKFEQK